MIKRVFFLSACIVVVAFHTARITAVTPPATFLKYKQSLSNELSKLQDEIYTTFGMSKLRWKLYKQSWKWGVQYRLHRLTSWFQLWGKSLSPRFRTIASRLFKKLRIRGTVRNAKDYIDPDETDPTKMDRDLYYGTSNGAYVYIDEETMTRDGLTDVEIEATILHELAHIVLEYNLARFCLKKLIASHANKTDEEKLKNLLKRLQHLHEKIADVFASLAGGLSIIEGLISEYQRFGCCESDTHPSCATRIAYLQALKTDMQADSHYSNGDGYGKAFSVSLP